jgi:glutaredoxin
MQVQRNKLIWRAPHARLAARCLSSLLLSGLALGQSAVQAQAVYRIVGPDGKVTFSDKPPLSATGKSTPTVNLMLQGQAEQANLPLELRQVAAKFPVTLYVSSNCAPCDSGRSLLGNRGIPFTEKTVNSAEDAQAFQKLSTNTSLPLLIIGGQHVAGFLASEWTQYLNAAGYPEQSKLPTGYRRAPATSLVTVKPSTAEATKPAAPSPAPAVVTPARQPGPTADNPAGIQF